MSETYQESQTRMIREARRVQAAADRRAEGDRLQGRGERGKGTGDRGQAEISGPVTCNLKPVTSPAPRPLKTCQECYDLGVSAGRERERLKRRWDWLAWAVIGALVGFVLGVALRPQFWGF